MNTGKREKIRKQLKNFSVGIAGLGGLGSNAAVALARAGVGKLVIVDFDRVEEKNLDRQYYFLDQIGLYKVDALKKTLLNINPDLEVVSFNVELEKGKMSGYFSTVDVVIEALDAAGIKTQFIEEISSCLPDMPIIAASGVAGVGRVDRIESKHFGNLHLCIDENAKSSEDDVLLASRVCLMACWEADLAIELLLGDDV
jgi:sulfur carrier protein ThiS adenylyltransferase